MLSMQSQDTEGKGEELILRAFNHATMRAKSLQSCPTLCYLMDCSLPGLSVHGILQTRILQCVAILSSRGSSRPRDRTCLLRLCSCIGR